jgi:hypothetical protein
VGSFEVFVRYGQQRHSVRSKGFDRRNDVVVGKSDMLYARPTVSLQESIRLSIANWTRGFGQYDGESQRGAKNSAPHSVLAACRHIVVYADDLSVDRLQREYLTIRFCHAVQRTPGQAISDVVDTHDPVAAGLRLPVGARNRAPSSKGVEDRPVSENIDSGALELIGHLQAVGQGSVHQGADVVADERHVNNAIAVPDDVSGHRV